MCIHHDGVYITRPLLKRRTRSRRPRASSRPGLEAPLSSPSTRQLSRRTRAPRPRLRLSCTARTRLGSRETRRRARPPAARGRRP
eukprot:21533-Pelagococcus_subviridis.AAC.2